MKCAVPRCPIVGVVVPNRRSVDVGPAAPPMCSAHRDRFIRSFRQHFESMRSKLTKGSKHHVVKARAAALIQAWAVSNNAKIKSWVATWVQMVDLELLNSGSGLGVQKGRLSETGEFVPDGAEVRLPSYPSYAKKKEAPLPEHATRAGQAAITKRVAEQELLERRLAAESADFIKGQRQVLELELKTKRAAELRASAKRAKG